jgi:hypothetical protein
VQKTHHDETGVTVETVFLHSSGQEISGGLLHVPAPKNDPQGYGSALTYCRRYSLMAACGIAPEDDDGQAASRPPAPRSEPPRPPDPPKRTWKDAVAEISDVETAGKVSKQLHEHFAPHGADPHDTIMRQLLARIAMLVGEGKIDETNGASISQIIREWIIKPTEIEDTERQAGVRF